MIANSTSAPQPVVVGPSSPPRPVVTTTLVRVVRPPQERQPTQNLFSPDDYPAAGNGVRGKVGVDLSVEEQGRVIGCRITQSSGSASLDVATCNILRRRARFTPAMDSNGNAALG